MHISKLSITNFRNFSNSNFVFKKGINTLIGENGTGKTNAFYAMRLMLDSSLPFSASKLLETDFNRRLEHWQGNWIIVSLEFSGLGDSDSEAAAMLAHKMEHVGDDSNNIGSYHMYYRPNKRIRKKLYILSNSPNKDAEVKKLLASITINDYETVYSFRGIADFTNPEVYEKLVGNFEKFIFPNPDDEKIDELGISTNQIFLVRNEISCTFVKALRNVVTDLKKVRDSPLLNLLRGTTKDVQVEKYEEISDKVKDLNHSISSLEEISKLTSRIKTTLNDTLGFTYAPNVTIKSELPNEINKLMNSLTLWVGDGDGEHLGKLEDLSLGGANLIYITLKLLEYEFNQPTEDKAAHFLLIEEPEAHIHTHIQKTIFDKYRFENTQVITSTHSSHISSASRISSINVLSKDRNGTYVCNPSNGLEETECIRIERYLDAVRSNLLFAKGVILVEGDTELILIPEMFKSVFGLSLDEIGVSIINMSSAVFDHIAKLFHDDRLHKKCSIITDSDQSLYSLPEDASEDTAELTKARNSEKSGTERKEKLDFFCKDNNWVHPFYAKHTFEVDFISKRNEYEIINTLNSIYKRDADKKSAKLKLESNSMEEKGKEVLRLAAKEGKGWFALLVAEHLSTRTLIPNYIIEAIVFATSHITDNHLKKMAFYRINKDSAYDEPEYDGLLHELTEFEQKEEITLSLLITLFEKHNPDDQFLIFYNLMQANKEVVTC